MKKIINNKLYDTDTAHKIGGWDNKSYGNAGFTSETLFRKRTGEYFLHGEGGNKSRYAEMRGPNSWGSGERIVPMPYDAAKQWAEEHLDQNLYQSEFGEIVEDDTNEAITLSLPSATVTLLRRKASEQGLALSALVNRIASRELGGANAANYISVK